ncbi:MAG: ATP-binding protein [Sedimentisphaerales bacterium]|nr:ATP-binding protein [Sedimentisphaerales bacterium]
MLDGPFDAITKDDIEALIADEVVETKRLDYKETLPGDTDKEKNRFVEDVCSFANAAGGHIIFGLRDKRDAENQKTGTPEYVGVPGVNIDREKLRIEHIILNKVEPRIPGIQVRQIDGFENGPVVVMRIPRSYNSPHMTRDGGRFRSRTESGNYAMDVQEIRSAFVSSETLPERVRQFRADRLARIVAGEIPVRLGDGPKMILHVAPLSAFGRKETYELCEIYQGRRLCPIGAGEFDTRHNFDGLLAYCRQRDEVGGNSYIQLFRDGTVEAVDANHIRKGAHEKGVSCAYEEDALDALENALRVQQDLGVELPVVVMLSLLGVRGYRIVGWDQKYPRHAPFPGHGLIDRDDLILDVVFIEHEYKCDRRQIMRPVFDAVANAAGWPGSMNYDP